MATAQDVIDQLNIIYASLDDMVLDGAGDPAQLAELAEKRDATRAQIDDLIAKGVARTLAGVDDATKELNDLRNRLKQTEGTVNRVRAAIDIAAQVIAVAAELVAKVV